MVRHRGAQQRLARFALLDAGGEGVGNFSTAMICIRVVMEAPSRNR
jgi:hypothetical protein